MLISFYSFGFKMPIIFLKDGYIGSSILAAKSKLVNAS
jgi:hypothetical protein